MAGSHRDRVELLQMQISLSQQVGVCLRSYRTAVNRQQQSAAEALNKRIDEILCMCGLDPALYTIVQRGDELSTNRLVDGRRPPDDLRPSQTAPRE